MTQILGGFWQEIVEFLLVLLNVINNNFLAIHRNLTSNCYKADIKKNVSLELSLACRRLTFVVGR